MPTSRDDWTPDDWTLAVYLTWGMPELCTAEQPGTYCAPGYHHALCYYARHPRGMNPPRLRYADE